MAVRASLVSLACCLAALVFTGCDGGAIDPVRVTLQTDFSSGADGWRPLFTNYPAGEETFYGLASGVRPLPASAGVSGLGYYLYGYNYSDDLNMHLVRQIDGLVPRASYDVSFRVTFATNAPTGCVGAGGPPGEAVTMHAIATSTEPALSGDAYTLNLVERYVPKGEFDSWYVPYRIGDIANGLPCEEALPEMPYRLKTLASADDHAQVRADRSGRAWLLVGTRSGFEADTGLYYDRVDVTLEPR